MKDNSISQNTTGKNEVTGAKEQELGKAKANPNAEKTKVFVFNLETYEIKEVEVDYISERGKAVIRSGGSSNPPKIYSNWSYSFEESYENCINHIDASLYLLKIKISSLIEIKEKLCGIQFRRGTR
jgi:hypothetical protein